MNVEEKYDDLLARMSKNLEWLDDEPAWDFPRGFADDVRMCVELLKNEKRKEKVKAGDENTRTAVDLYTKTEEVRTALDMLGDWCEAYAEGRLVVLPCKIGDTVYYRTYEPGGKYIGIMPHRVGKFTTFAVAEREDGRITNLPIQFFGKSIFLAREDAKAALIEQQKLTTPVEWIKEDAER